MADPYGKPIVVRLKFPRLGYSAGTELGYDTLADAIRGLGTHLFFDVIRTQDGTPVREPTPEEIAEAEAVAAARMMATRLIRGAEYDPYLGKLQAMPSKAELDAVQDSIATVQAIPPRVDAVETAVEASAPRALRADTRVVDVRAYGATGNGTTDDRAAINNAITAAAAVGGEVFLPAGTYRITGTLFLRTGTSIRGVGDASVIRCEGAPAYFGMVNIDTAGGNHDITLRGFVLDVTKNERPADTTSGGIRVLAPDGSPSRNVSIEGVWVRNVPYAAIQVMNVRGVNIRHNRVSNTGRDGITVWFNSSEIDVSHNRVWQARDDCIAINAEGTGHTGTAPTDVVVIGNEVEQAADSIYGGGLRFEGVHRGVMQGNIVRFSVGHGIIVDGGLLTNTPCRDITVSGNIVRNAGNASTGGNGISVTSDAHDEVTIANNTVRAWYGKAIHVASPHVSVTGNRIADAQAGTANPGISIEADACVVTANVIRKTSQHGIRVIANATTVTGNRLVDCGRDTASVPYIVVDPGYSRNLVSGNHVSRVTAGHGSHGVRLAGGAGAGNVVEGNQVIGFTAATSVSSGATGAGNVLRHSGAGTPEGVIDAQVGSTYTRTDGAASTTFYIKESGTGNTGWVAK